MKYVEAVANIVCATLLDPKVLQKARRRKTHLREITGAYPIGP